MEMVVADDGRDGWLVMFYIDAEFKTSARAK